MMLFKAVVPGLLVSIFCCLPAFSQESSGTYPKYKVNLFPFLINEARISREDSLSDKIRIENSIGTFFINPVWGMMGTLLPSPTFYAFRGFSVRTGMKYKIGSSLFAQADMFYEYKENFTGWGYERNIAIVNYVYKNRAGLVVGLSGDFPELYFLHSSWQVGIGASYIHNNSDAYVYVHGYPPTKAPLKGSMFGNGSFIRPVAQVGLMIGISDRPDFKITSGNKVDLMLNLSRLFTGVYSLNAGRRIGSSSFYSWLGYGRIYNGRLYNEHLLNRVASGFSTSKYFSDARRYRSLHGNEVMLGLNSFFNEKSYLGLSCFYRKLHGETEVLPSASYGPYIMKISNKLDYGFRIHKGWRFSLPASTFIDFNFSYGYNFSRAAGRIQGRYTVYKDLYFNASSSAYPVFLAHISIGRSFM